MVVFGLVEGRTEEDAVTKEGKEGGREDGRVRIDVLLCDSRIEGREGGREGGTYRKASLGTHAV